MRRAAVSNQKLFGLKLQHDACRRLDYVAKHDAAVSKKFWLAPWDCKNILHFWV